MRKLSYSDSSEVPYFTKKVPKDFKKKTNRNANI